METFPWKDNKNIILELLSIIALQKTKVELWSLRI